MKYKKVTLGQVEAIVNKLGGPEGVRDFLSGKFIFEKKEVERKLRVLTKEKHFNFLNHSWRDYAVGKGIVFTSREEEKTMFYSLVDENFTELSEEIFKMNKQRIRKNKDSLNETILTNELVSPTSIAQDILFIIKKMEQKLSSHTEYRWYFVHNQTKYYVRLSLLEEKGSLREIYLMSCGFAD